jgi:hypothetical protein
MLVVKSWFDEEGCLYMGMEVKDPSFIRLEAANIHDSILFHGSTIF